MKKLIIILICMSNVALAKPLTVILDWFVNPDHAPLIIAQKKGFFKQAGVQVNLIAPANGSDGAKLVAAGKADIAVTYQPEFMVQVQQGLPLAWISTLVNQPLNCLVVLKNGPIKTISDLKGKNVAHVSGFSNIMLKAMLNKHGLTLKDVKLISMNQGLTAALMAHRIDAFTGAMRNFEPIEMRLNGSPARLFYPEKNGVPSYDELILVVNKSEKNDPRIKKFNLALQKAMRYLLAHPQESWQLFAKTYPNLNNPLNHEAWFASIPYFDPKPLIFHPARWTAFGAFLKQEGFLKQAIPSNDFR